MVLSLGYIPVGCIRCKYYNYGTFSPCSWNNNLFPTHFHSNHDIISNYNNCNIDHYWNNNPVSRTNDKCHNTAHYLNIHPYVITHTNVKGYIKNIYALSNGYSHSTITIRS